MWAIEGVYLLFEAVEDVTFRIEFLATFLVREIQNFFNELKLWTITTYSTIWQYISQTLFGFLNIW